MIEAFLERLKRKELLVETYGDLPKTVAYLTYDSRKVQKNTLFVCKGRTFKESYLLMAKEKGATLYLSESVYQVEDIAGIIVKDIRQAMAIVADCFYESPWKDLPLIGITGTKGKSTTTMFLESILSTAYKRRVGLSSSLTIYDGTIDKPSVLTTPESLDLYEHIKNAKNNHLPAMIVEVSSQALKYRRVGELGFSHGVFLNIGDDHIGPIEHEDFEDYFESKLMLFNQAKKAYVNLDAEKSDIILKRAKASSKVITFSCEKESDYFAYHIKPIAKGIQFFVKSLYFDALFTISVSGSFNVENALAAIAVASEMGISVEVIQEGLSLARVKGRMEVIEKTSSTPKVIVDYAHNKLSFERVLQSARKELSGGKIWVVFGAPGAKAQSRRKDLGEMASLYADEIILTYDDAYLENPKTIADEIISGFVCEKKARFIEDRKEAIQYAIENASCEDIILLLGKGAEVLQKTQEGNMPYPGDYKNAIFALSNRGKVK